MSRLLYDGLVRAYRLAIGVAAAAGLPKARHWTAGRRDTFAQLETQLRGNTNPIAWFHCASLGEFEQGRPLIEAYRNHYPRHRILLTFFSPSGYEVRKNYAGADFVHYLPLDTARNAARFLALARPRVAVFVKYEFWYHYLTALRARRVPALLVSAIFRPGQLFFKPYGGFYRQMLGCFTHIFVQNEASRQLLAPLGLPHVRVAGDTRFDRVQQVSQARRDIPLAAAFANGQPTLIIGSAWPADRAVLVPFLRQFAAPLKIIVAPHEIHETDLTDWARQLGKSAVRYSRADEEAARRAAVLLVDNVGMLASLYYYGTFAYVGGGFGKGIHNILEAAAFGLAPFFGPNHARFQEATDLLAAGAATAVAQTSDFAAAFEALYTDQTRRTQLGEVARQYVADRTGATQRVMQTLTALD